MSQEGVGLRIRHLVVASQKAGDPAAAGVQQMGVGLDGGVGRDDVDAGDDIGSIELRRRLEVAAIQVDRLLERIGREVRCERER